MINTALVKMAKAKPTKSAQTVVSPLIVRATKENSQKAVYVLKHSRSQYNRKGSNLQLMPWNH